MSAGIVLCLQCQPGLLLPCLGLNINQHTSPQRWFIIDWWNGTTIISGLNNSLMADGNGNVLCSVIVILTNCLMIGPVKCLRQFGALILLLLRRTNYLYKIGYYNLVSFTHTAVWPCLSDQGAWLKKKLHPAPFYVFLLLLVSSSLYMVPSWTTTPALRRCTSFLDGYVSY